MTFSVASRYASAVVIWALASIAITHATPLCCMPSPGNEGNHGLVYTDVTVLTRLAGHHVRNTLVSNTDYICAGAGGYTVQGLAGMYILRHPTTGAQVYLRPCNIKDNAQTQEGKLMDQQHVEKSMLAKDKFGDPSQPMMQS